MELLTQIKCGPLVHFLCDSMLKYDIFVVLLLLLLWGSTRNTALRNWYKHVLYLALKMCAVG